MMNNSKLDVGDLRVICKEDCNNAPRKEVIRDFNIVFALGNIEGIMDHVTEDVQWNIVGDRIIQGKSAMEQALIEMKSEPAIELRLDNLITHGYVCAANGVISFKNEKKYSFCDVYIFSSAARHGKIKEITSYCIEL